MFSRRQFLTYVGVGTYELMRSSTLMGAATFPSRKKLRSNSKFTSIAPSGLDKLVLPKGYQYDLVSTMGDPLGTKGPLGAETFGADNDFLAFFPIDALQGGKNPREGLLFVNHENVLPVFVSDYSGEGPKTPDQIQKEKLAVGASIIHVKREGKNWKRIDSKYTKRLCALYPKIAMTGPVRQKLPETTGTLANCSGGVTPWNTVLTCEENFQNMNPIEKGLGWEAHAETKINEAEYGWVVEIDPFGELPPMKHSALGRFGHENVAMRITPEGELVAYMGDDFEDQYFYKFVSDGKYNPKAPRAENRKLLTAGTLYVADFANGKWIPMDPKRTPDLKKEGFNDLSTVLFNCRDAAKAAKGTPTDRPEDCEVHPLDGSVYIAFTNNGKHGNNWGQIVRLVEQNDDAKAEKFRYEIFLAGGPQSGMGSPDNLVFDKQANLWVVCDVSSKALNRGANEPFLNNGMHMVPTRGPNAGEAFQFASSPNEAELTGPFFTDNQDTLFVSVQHPGENSINKESPTSHWPRGGNEIPRSAVVAITGFKS